MKLSVTSVEMMILLNRANRTNKDGCKSKEAALWAASLLVSVTSGVDAALFGGVGYAVDG
jgi:hypothetical protein